MSTNDLDRIIALERKVEALVAETERLREELAAAVSDYLRVKAEERKLEAK